MVTPGQASLHLLTRVLVAVGNMFPTTQVTWFRKGSGRLVLGNSHQVRFRPSAAELFPELEGLSVTPRAGGKPSIEVPTAPLPDVTTAGQSKVEYIIFLNRIESGAPDLVPFPRELGLQWASQFSSRYRSKLMRYKGASIGELLKAQLFELRYDTLDWAVARLEGMIRTGEFTRG